MIINIFTRTVTAAPASTCVYFPGMAGLQKNQNQNKKPTTDKHQEHEELLHVKSYLGHWCIGGTSSSPYKNLLDFFWQCYQLLSSFEMQVLAWSKMQETEQLRSQFFCMHPYENEQKRDICPQARTPDLCWTPMCFLWDCRYTELCLLFANTEMGMLNPLSQHSAGTGERHGLNPPSVWDSCLAQSLQNWPSKGYGQWY